MSQVKKLMNHMKSKSFKGELPSSKNDPKMLTTEVESKKFLTSLNLTTPK